MFISQISSSETYFGAIMTNCFSLYVSAAGQGKKLMRNAQLPSWEAQLATPPSIISADEKST
jgi:hypothetical protein